MKDIWCDIAEDYINSPAQIKITKNVASKKKNTKLDERQILNNFKILIDNKQSKSTVISLKVAEKINEGCNISKILIIIQVIILINIMSQLRLVLNFSQISHCLIIYGLNQSILLQSINNQFP